MFTDDTDFSCLRVEYTDTHLRITQILVRFDQK